MPYPQLEPGFRSPPMDALHLPASYFAIANPFLRIGRWRHRFRHEACIRLNGRQLRVRWTERAERELARRASPLTVELQLYFSCVVKKRVLFRETADRAAVAAGSNLALVFRAVAAAACDPARFAAEFPEGRSLMAGPMANLPPQIVELDFRRGRWLGDCRYATG